MRDPAGAFICTLRRVGWWPASETTVLNDDGDVLDLQRVPPGLMRTLIWLGCQRAVDEQSLLALKDGAWVSPLA